MKYGWHNMVVMLCEMLNYNAGDIYNLPFFEFLFWCSYKTDRDNEEKKQLKRMQQQSRR